MAGPMREGQMRERVDFDSVQLLMDFEPPNPSLIVSGKLPSPMEVKLEPVKEVVVEPEYWPTELVGYHSEITTPAQTPFSVRGSLAHLSTGSRGIEVVGRSRSEKVEVPGRD